VFNTEIRPFKQRKAASYKQSQSYWFLQITVVKGASKCRAISHRTISLLTAPQWREVAVVNLSSRLADHNASCLSAWSVCSWQQLSACRLTTTTTIIIITPTNYWAPDCGTDPECTLECELQSSTADIHHKSASQKYIPVIKHSATDTSTTPLTRSVSNGIHWHLAGAASDFYSRVFKN